MRALPIRFRPHSVKLIKQLQENAEGVAENQIISIAYVKVDTGYGILQSKRGIQTDDKIIVYIELAGYTAFDEDGKVLRYIDDFIIRPDDELLFHDVTYVVTSVNEITLDRDYPIRLEITAK